MLTLKPMYKENKLWNSSFLPPSIALEFITSQLVACYWCPFFFTYAVASYGCCYSCYSYSTRVEKEKEVATIE
jgi:hypothetical protein